MHYKINQKKLVYLIGVILISLATGSIQGFLLIAGLSGIAYAVATSIAED